MSRNRNEVVIVRGRVRPLGVFDDAIRLLRETGSYWPMVGISFVGVYVGQSVPLGALFIPLWIGCHLAVLQMLDGRKAQFAVLGRPFERFKDILGVTLVHIGVQLLVTLVVGAVYFGTLLPVILATPHGAEPDPEEFRGAMVAFFAAYGACLVGVLLYFFFTLFAAPLVFDRKLGTVEALRTSAAGVMANFGGVLGWWLLTTLMLVLSACCCIVMPFVLPLWVTSHTLVMNAIFPREVVADTFD
ncbi:MAG: hypothetical protein R3F20_16685 [Planctomycetota bacterium]